MEYLKGAADTALMHIEAGRSFISAHTPAIVSDTFSKVGSIADTFFSVCKNMLKSTESYLKNRVLPFLEKKLLSGKDIILNNPKISGGIAVALVAITAVIIAIRCLRKKTAMEIVAQLQAKITIYQDATKKDAAMDPELKKTLSLEMKALQSQLYEAVEKEAPEQVNLAADAAPLKKLFLLKAANIEYNQEAEKNNTSDPALQESLQNKAMDLEDDLSQAIKIKAYANTPPSEESDEKMAVELDKQIKTTLAQFDTAEENSAERKDLLKKILDITKTMYEAIENEAPAVAIVALIRKKASEYAKETEKEGHIDRALSKTFHKELASLKLLLFKAVEREATTKD